MMKGICLGEKANQKSSSEPAIGRAGASPFASFKPENEKPSAQDLERFARFSHHFAEIDILPQPVVQAKLIVGPPGDKYEQEADRVARQVLDTTFSSGHDSTYMQKGKDNLARLGEKEMAMVQRRVAGMAFHPIADVTIIDPSLERSIKGARGRGVPLDRNIHGPMQQAFSADFNGVRVHADAQSDRLCRSIHARAFTSEEDIFLRQDEKNLSCRVGQELIAHELTHVIQQRSHGTGKVNKTIQRRISPEDVRAEMIGRTFEVTGPFTAGPIQLSGGETVHVIGWINSAVSARVQLPAPYQHAFTPFDIPKRLLRQISPTSTGVAPYSAGLEQVVRSIERGEQAIAREQARRGGPRPGEIPRLKGLQQTRERLLNRRLIQETMFNRFDQVIQRWTDHYNRHFGYSGRSALDPNLVKSLLFQESQMGTSGQHLEVPPTHPVKTRFNLGQVIDSSASALLIMIHETQPALITTYHLQNIGTDLADAQREIRTLQTARNLNPVQQARLEELTRLSGPGRTWENFLWGYVARGQATGFSDAATDFFNSVGATEPQRNVDYDFWIRTAIRWLFEKRRTVRSWEEAIRAYNGSGASARHYREAVTERARRSAAAQSAGQEFIPSNI